MERVGVVFVVCQNNRLSDVFALKEKPEAKHIYGATRSQAKIWCISGLITLNPEVVPPGTVYRYCKQFGLRTAIRHVLISGARANICPFMCDSTNLPIS